MNSPAEYVPDTPQQAFKFPRPRGRPKRHKKGPWTGGPKGSRSNECLFEQLELALGGKPND